MANAPIGTNIWEGELGVVRVEFDDTAMGKTTEDTTLTFIEDIKDIMFQQDGTQPADKIPTGQAWECVVKFGEIDTELLSLLVRGATVSAATGDAVKLGRDLYRSGLANFAKRLRLKRVDSDGTASTDLRHWLTFYSAMPTVTGNFVWGADTQRDVEVTFYCFWNSTEEAFGYSGYASSVGL